MTGERNPRAVAAHCLAALLEERCSLSRLLPHWLAQLTEPASRALAQELCYGVVRWYVRLEALTGRLLERPLKARDRDVQALLLIGLYQLIYMRVPAHAAVNETVAASAALRKPWARGLINAVLRNFQRQAQALLADIDRDAALRLAYPGWWLERIRRDWPDDWEALLAAGNARPPLVLRVNLSRQSLEDYRQRLQAAGLQARPLSGVASALVLDEPVDVAALPGFAAGDVSVQDGAAQLAAPLLGAQRGERVLDACAAPGGKACHVLEAQPELDELVVLDSSASRLQQVGENLQRLGLAATALCGDARSPQAWWDGEPFDRILLDAPCSASGVVRRHPDIKLLRRAQDIAALAALQAEILDALWPLLRPGGLLLYVTCSILPAENSDQVAAFLRRHSDAHAVSLPQGWGRVAGVGRQNLSGEHGMDGFFYARIHKQARGGACDD